MVGSRGVGLIVRGGGGGVVDKVQHVRGHLVWFFFFLQEIHHFVQIFFYLLKHL